MKKHQAFVNLVISLPKFIRDDTQIKNQEKRENKSIENCRPKCIFDKAEIVDKSNHQYIDEHKIERGETK